MEMLVVPYRWSTQQNLNQLYVLVYLAHKTTHCDMTCTVLKGYLNPHINKNLRNTQSTIVNLITVSCLSTTHFITVRNVSQLYYLNRFVIDVGIVIHHKGVNN